MTFLNVRSVSTEGDPYQTYKDIQLIGKFMQNEHQDTHTYNHIHTITHTNIHTDSNIMAK